MQQPENQPEVQRLLDENARGLVLYARQWVAFAAEDIVQDAFCKLLDEKPFPKSPKAWLYRVVRNKAIDHVRREKRSNADSPRLENWFRPSEEPIWDGEEITKILEKLAPTVREIIVSKIWGGLTFREIANLTNLSTSAVHKKYQQGIEQMRGEMKNEK